MIRRHVVSILAGAALALSGATVARAIPTTVSDSLTVFDPTGAIFAQVIVTEANEDPNQTYFINIPNLIDPNQFGNPTSLIETNGQHSDIFGVANTNGGLFLGFNSDSETVPAPFGPGPIVLNEPPGGITVSATQYLNPALQEQGFTAQFFSDGDKVPEPATLLLVGTGLAGIAVRRRKRSA